MNHKDAPYIVAVADQFVNSMKQLSILSESGMRLLSRTLWSLAVLELLDSRRFSSVSRLLTKSVGSNEESVHPWMAKQLTQVHLELILKEDNFSDTPQVKSVFDNLLQWKQFNKSSYRDNQSSYTHLDASKILNTMGIIHENEKILQHGYVVDIFINNIGTRNDSSDRSCSSVKVGGGTVIEFDGPFHFESYLNVSSFMIYIYIHTYIYIHICIYT